MSYKKHKALASGPRKPPEIDPVAGTREAMESVRYLRFVVTTSAATLTMGFGWLKFRGVDLIGVLHSVPADFVLKLAMALYFASWIAGLLSDLADMEFVLVKSPSPVHVKVGGTLVGILTAIAFGLLCYVETMQHFSIALLVLLVINTIGWLYLTRIVLPAAESISHSFYTSQGRMLRLEQLNIVCRHFQGGSWQLIRLTLGLLAAITMTVLSHKYAVLALEVQVIQTYGDILSASVFLVYVLVLEGWIWFMRMRVKGGLSLLLEIEHSYELRRRAN
jgi:hypothetical protein